MTGVDKAEQKALTGMDRAFAVLTAPYS